MAKLMNNVNRDQRGITGLETAIILIAFVVVASVFAYTIISAGLFATQKSQEAVFEGLEEVQSTLELDGYLIAQDTDDNEAVDQIRFSVKLALMGKPIDFSPKAVSSSTDNAVVLCYMDKNQWKEDLCFTATAVGKNDGDSLLELDEKFVITIPRLESGTQNVLSPTLLKSTTFSIELRPPNGATLLLERTTPGEIDKVMNML
ncbi:MAG: hypothetical protein HOC20_12295 [Chloroflexi bacterium]|jgi:archaeal flagellin FlaB|nr:hypothetical protein [Chloroflexota bacterium]